MSQFTVKWSELANQGSSWESIGGKINSIGQKADSIARKIDASEKSLAQIRSQLTQYTKNNAYPVAERFRETGKSVQTIADLYAWAEGNVHQQALANEKSSPLHPIRDTAVNPNGLVDGQVEDVTDMVMDGLELPLGLAADFSINQFVKELDLPKWAGQFASGLLTVLLNGIKNYDRFQVDGELTSPRWLIQTVVESTVDFGLEALLNLIPGFQGLGATIAKWGVDIFFKALSGKTIAEWAGDLLLDFLMPGTNPEAKWTPPIPLDRAGGGSGGGEMSSW